MARSPRAKVDTSPAEPDILDDQVLPRAATRLIGHDGVLAELAVRFRTAPPSGIILAGPRGIGKATLAFRLAKALMSAAPLTTDLSVPDGDPDARLVAGGAHPRVLHLTRPWDGDKKRFKTELTVDTVRTLVPFLGATTPGGGWRVIIIDSLDEMNTNAANAILKALEEPPVRTVFLMVAHAPGRVLPTIRSRASLLPLKPLPTEAVAAVLTHLGVDPGHAEGAGGSVRAALTFAGAGGEAIANARAVLTKPMVEPATWHRLASLATDKRGASFDAVVDLTLDALAARSRRAVGPAAGEGAKAYLDALSERRRVEIFNLDKRAFVLGLCERLAALDHRR